MGQYLTILQVTKWCCCKDDKGPDVTINNSIKCCVSGDAIDARDGKYFLIYFRWLELNKYLLEEEQ